MMQVQHPRTLQSCYTKLQYVANGSFGYVCKGVSRLNPQKIIAIKEIDRRRFDQQNIEILLKTVQRQIESNQKIRETKCPFIVEFIEYFQAQNVVSFIFEFCQKTLYSLIEPYLTPQYFSKREYILVKILYQMLLTLKVLESLHMIHRDIKSENILICESIAKLGDFGFCREINENLTSGRGSLRTTAPQSHTSKSYNKCDIWSLGVTIYTLLYGVEPFEEKLRNVKDPMSFKNIIVSKDFRTEIRSESKLSEILKKMIVIEETERSSVSQLLSHQIFNSNNLNTTSDWIRQWLLFSSVQRFQNNELSATVLGIIGCLFSECKVSYQLHKVHGKQIIYFLSIHQILLLFIKMLDELHVLTGDHMRFIEFINGHFSREFIGGLMNDLKAKNARKMMVEGFERLYGYVMGGSIVGEKVVELRNICSSLSDGEVKSVIAGKYSEFIIFPTLNKIIEHTDKFKWALGNIIAIAMKEKLDVPKFYFNERLEYHEHISAL